MYVEVWLAGDCCRHELLDLLSAINSVEQKEIPETDFRVVVTVAESERASVEKMIESIRPGFATMYVNPKKDVPK
jgi:hypothetical protein